MKEEQLKILEEMRKSLVDYLHSDPNELKARNAANRAHALTAAISELRLCGEMMEKAAQILFVDSETPFDRTKDTTLYNLGDGWAINDREEQFTSPLAAFAKVKEQL